MRSRYLVSLMLLTTAFSAAAQEPADRASYDPVPRNWSIVLNRPGWLVVGARYCAQSGECRVLGEELGAIPLDGGRSAPPQLGCRLNPDHATCVKGRVLVQLLAQAPPMESIIVKMNGRNFNVPNDTWSFEHADGSAVGGPIMVEQSGRLMPLHYLQTGKTQGARAASNNKAELRRMWAAADDLATRGKRCDKLESVMKNSSGSFTAICVNKGKNKKYDVHVSGVE